MAITFNFANRFSFPSADGITPSVNYDQTQLLTESQILAANNELKRYVDIVRRYSKVISLAPAKEIFNVATTISDPRIGLVLGAEKRKDNNLPIFLGLDTIVAAMFNDSSRINSLPNTPNNDVFADGIRRVSAAFTAATLIGQLSQIPEQFEHARLIEQQALDDLDRVVSNFLLTADAVASNRTDNAANQALVSFYFEPSSFVIPQDRELVLEWYVPNINITWTPITTYRGALESYLVVSDLADAINATSTAESPNELLAVAEQAGPALISSLNSSVSTFHSLIFYPRKAVPTIISSSINVRLRLRAIVGEPPITLPSDTIYVLGLSCLKWGPYSDNLAFYPVNGCLIILSRQGALSSSTTAAREVAYQPTVLYFRRASTAPVPPNNALLRFSIQPWQPGLIETADAAERQEISVTIPRLLGVDADSQLELDSLRYSQIAVALVEAMSQISISSKAAGAIIRNDPLTLLPPTSAVELVAWSTTRVITAIILDIHEIPSDLELAVGNILAPRTAFSRNPKSVRVPVIIASASLGNGLLEVSSASATQTGIVKRRKSNTWKQILDEAENVYG